MTLKSTGSKFQICVSDRLVLYLTITYGSHVLSGARTPSNTTAPIVKSRVSPRTIAPYVDPFDAGPRSVQDQDSEEDEASEEERNAVEFEVSRFQEEPIEDKQSEPDHERELEREHAQRQDQLRELERERERESLRELERDREREAVADISHSTNHAPGMAHARRRSEYLCRIKSNRARESRLMSIHSDIYPGADIEDCWLDPGHEEEDFAHLFRLIDSFLLQPKPVPNRLEHYYLDQGIWARIHGELMDIFRVRRALERDADVPLPPPWPGKFRTDGEDGSGEYRFAYLEDLAILYRHLVETWLAVAWEEKPLSMEQQIEKLPDKYRIKWKKHYADRSTVSDELRETFGNDYKARVEEDAIARLTAAERPLLPEGRIDPQITYQEVEPRAGETESRLPSIVGSRSS
ncbi:hypothetical protein FRC01_002909 [Tulasnella sp. 417]|nr:hypothetical protein FRC01_002909 [Tulasnella sp. 417]